MEITIDVEEYKNLLKSEIILEILRHAVKTEKYLGREEVAKYLQVELKEDE